jgi:nitroimidazol reductase NimA-like FMN-containing flavoprotein (pyridoxamine 5'-phosphate oxidase superfamily)
MTGAETARAVLDANSFMTLATADEAGKPWATPVWFATEDYYHLYWLSKPITRHSGNLAVRPEVAIVVYDSTSEPGAADAVYLVATAAQVPDAELESALGLYNRVSVRSGLKEFGMDTVTGDGRLRVYRATVTEHYILDASTDTRIAVTP